MDLPNDVLEYALGMMPACARQWGAARVNKRLHALLADKTISISARDPELPVWMLERILADIQAGRVADAGTKDNSKPLALLMEARAAAGDLPGLQLLRSKGLPWQLTDKLCAAAAAGGHAQLLRWLRCQSPPCPWGSASACAEAAAAGGHLQALQFIMQERFLSAWDVSVCAERAAAAGHLLVLKWLADASPASPDGGLILDEGACAEAAAAGHEHVLSWLRSIGTPWDPQTCVLAAAAAGHIHILRFIAAALGPAADCWDDRATAVAAHTGRLPVLRWLRGGMAQPCPWSELTCAAAAAAGNLEVLTFLRGQDTPCPWDESTTAAAAKAGHLDVLMWTQQVQPPAPLDPAACLAAAKYRHPDVTRWLLQEFGW